MKKLFSFHILRDLRKFHATKHSFFLLLFFSLLLLELQWNQMKFNWTRSEGVRGHSQRGSERKKNYIICWHFPFFLSSWKWIAETARIRKYLRPMEIKFDSQKHSSQTRIFFWFHYVITGASEQASRVNGKVICLSLIGTSKHHDISHLSVSTIDMSEKENKIRERMKQLNILLKFMDRMTSFYYLSNRKTQLLLMECFHMIANIRVTVGIWFKCSQLWRKLCHHFT